MITYLKKKEVTDKVIVYNYGSNKNKIDGTVKILREDEKLPPQFTSATGDEGLSFAKQAVFAIIRFVRENKFPDNFIRSIG